MSKHNYVPTKKLKEINDRNRQARIAGPGREQANVLYGALGASIAARAEAATPAPAPETARVAPITRDARVGMAAVAGAIRNTEPTPLTPEVEQPAEPIDAVDTSVEVPPVSGRDAELEELIAEQAEDAAEDNIPINPIEAPKTPQPSQTELDDALDPGLAQQDVFEELNTVDPAIEFTPDTSNAAAIARTANDYEGNVAHSRLDGTIQSVHHGDDAPEDRERGLPDGFSITKRP